MVVEPPTAVAGAVEGLGDGRWRAAFDEAFSALSDGLVVGGGGVLSAEGLFDFLLIIALVLVVQFPGYAAGGQERTGLTGRTPLVGLSDVAALVDVVGVGEKRKPQLVGEAQQEAAPQPSLVCSSCRFHVADISLIVFIFENHVHDVATGIHVVAKSLAAVGLFLIDLQVPDGVVWQVLKQHFLVAAEEGTGTEEQFIDLAAVDEDLAVGIHGYAWQLADEVVEHGAIGHLEGRGVVDERIAAVVHLDLRGSDGQFAHGLGGTLAHLQCWHIYVIL